MNLPPGYRLEEDADTLALLRPDGSTVAVFSAHGATAEAIERAAWDDHRERG